MICWKINVCAEYEVKGVSCKQSVETKENDKKFNKIIELCSQFQNITLYRNCIRSILMMNVWLILGTTTRHIIVWPMWL